MIKYGEWMLFNSIIFTCDNRRTMSVQQAAYSSMRDDSMGHGFVATMTEAALTSISGGVLFAHYLLSFLLAV